MQKLLHRLLFWNKENLFLRTRPLCRFSTAPFTMAKRGIGLLLPAGTLASASPQGPSVAAPPAIADDALLHSLSAVSASGIRCVVWDFDLTIMAIHTFAERILPAAVATRSLDTDFRDLAFFVKLVRELQSRGIGVAVASFGRNDTIQAYLARAFAEAAPLAPLTSASAGAGAPASADAAVPPFSSLNVLTPASVGLTDGCSMRGGKNRLLQHICETLGVSPAQILFFDGEWPSTAEPVTPD